MKRITILTLSSLAFAHILHAGEAPAVVPALREWKSTEGTLSLANARVAVSDESLAETARIFAEDLADLGEAAKLAEKEGPPAVQLSLSKDKALGEEGYQLEVAAEGVRISAPTQAGVFHGTRTLLQMLKLSPAGELPRGIATDFPSFKKRMLMLDVAREPFPIPALKDYLRMMAWHKMNELHLHLSDESRGDRYAIYRIESRKFPGLTAKDLSYSFADLRDLQDFAKARGITITPEVDMPGHARVFVNHWPELGHPKLGPSSLDVRNPKTAETMKSLLDEVIPLFDAPDFHIGTDEFNLSALNPQEREEVGEAFRKFINEMNAHVRSKGKNTRIWSGFEHMPGTTQPDPSVTVDMWVTRDAMALINAGNKVINSSDATTYIVPAAHYYGVSNPGVYADWTPDRISNDPSKNPPKDHPNLLGGKLHVWNDMGPAGYTMMEIADVTYPSIQVFAEKMWGTKGSKDYAEFQGRAQGVSPVPGVSVFGRLAGSPGEEFLADPEERTLTAVDSVIPLAMDKSPRADLEYPWTLTVEVMKTAETGKRGVILSSDLVEICSDFSRTKQRPKTGPDGKPATDDKGKAINENYTATGIGIVRASGAFGKDPLDSVKSDQTSDVYAGTLPLNQWVKLTVLAERGRTTVFVDGKKTGFNNTQMVCPLRRLGSTTGNSFVGKVRNLRVVDRLDPPEG